MLSKEQRETLKESAYDLGGRGAYYREISDAIEAIVAEHDRLAAEVERLRTDATLGSQMRALIPVGENLHLRVSWEVAEADSIVIVNSLTLERALRALVDLLPDSKEHFCQKPIEPPPGADWGTSYTPCDKCESCLAWQAAHDALAACECEEVGE